MFNLEAQLLSRMLLNMEVQDQHSCRLLNLKAPTQQPHLLLNLKAQHQHRLMLNLEAQLHPRLGDAQLA
jgi:hypothetical protein